MKRFVLGSVLIPLIILGATEVRADCLGLDYAKYTHYPMSMTYDTTVGITLAMYRSYGASYTARVPKLIAGQPNPDFDRIYGLLLKALPTQTMSQLCFSTTATSGATVDITSVTVMSEGMQKVTICDPGSANRCASVDFGLGVGAELRTSK